MSSFVFALAGGFSSCFIIFKLELSFPSTLLGGSRLLNLATSSSSVIG